MSAPTMWRYDLRFGFCGMESATVVLTSDGLFLSGGSFGSYHHQWHLPPELNFRKSLVAKSGLRHERGEWLRRFSRPDVYSGEATFQSIRTRICQQRRDRSWTKEKARQEWDLLTDCNDVNTLLDFGAWHDQTSLEDNWASVVYDFPIWAQQFVDLCIPVLLARLRADLAAEALVVSKETP